MRGRPAGITLTEILIAIMILGIGLVSLATLFPIGLLRLREAQRQTRSAYLFESATADVAARGLLNKNSFVYADFANLNPPGFPMWFLSPLNPDGSGRYNPLTHDTAFYGADAFDPANPGASSPGSGGYGLPFAYDPLWRFQTTNPATGTQGYYPDPIGQTTIEARFASGVGWLLRPEVDNNGPPSAYGLQRLTNFNRPIVMPAALQVPSIFVSPEDVVWQEEHTTNVWPFNQPQPTTVSGQFSTVLPDLGLTMQNAQGTASFIQDWRFTWMITAQQNNSSNGAGFEGNIVIWENRPFAIDANGFIAGEPVYEAIFGYSANVVIDTIDGYRFGYGAGADRTVLIRWQATQPDPIIKVGDWIADVTYERQQVVVTNRFLSFNGGGGVPNPLNKLEWDNLPAQRCFWYQVQKVGQAQPDPALGPAYRSIVLYVNRTLDARTLLDNTGTPVYQNAALVSPNVVNVIPQTFFVR
jgi:type II secretory pathway pseudopilin PulG